MAKSGIKNYAEYSKSLLSKISTKPISFEVFADNNDEMVIQALKIASWGKTYM